MKKRHYPRLDDLGVRYPIPVLITAVLLTVVSIFLSSKLRVDSNITSLVPSSLESVRSLEQLKENFGGLGYLVVVIESKDPGEARDFADHFAGRIEAHPEVHYVEYRRPFEYFKKRMWLYFDREDLQEVERRVDRVLELQKKGISPVFSDLMDFADPDDRAELNLSDMEQKYEKKFGLQAREVVSGEEGKLLVVQIKLKENPHNLDATRKFVAAIREMEKDLREQNGFEGISVGYTGSYQKMIEQSAMVRRQIAFVSVTVTVLLFLILVLYFRRVNAAFLIIFPITLSILWTGGVVFLFLGRLNMITGFAAAVLAGLGSDYGIYLLSRFHQERARGRDFEETRQLVFAKTGRATYLSTLTAVGAFGALILSKFDLFVEFGWVGVIGLGMNYLAMMVVLPALLLLEERWKGGRESSARFAWGDGLLHRFGHRVSQALGRTLQWSGLYRTALLSALLLAGLSVPVVAQIQFEDGQLEDEGLPSFRLSRRISDLLPTSRSPTIFLAEGIDEERRIVRTLEDLLKKGDRAGLVFDHVTGLSSFIPEFQMEKKEILKRMHGKVETAGRLGTAQRTFFLESLSDSASAMPINAGDLPREVRRSFESSRTKDLYSIHLNPSFGRVSSETMRRYHEGIMDLKRKINFKGISADGTFVNDDIIHLVEEEAPKGMILVLVFLSVITFLKIRPRRRGVMLFAHLVGSLILLSGLMWIFRMQLNIINLAVIPIVLGTGIDCFIHLSERLEESGALFETLREEIPTILISNLTSIVGFGGLLFTSSSGLRSAGGVAVLGILVVTVVCIFCFPHSLHLVRKHSFTSSPQTAEAEMA